MSCVIIALLFKGGVGMTLINSQELSQLKRLINISRMIEDLYSKLYNLELNNEKDSSEYQKYLDYLKLVLEMEKEEYLKLNLNEDKISRYFEYINDAYNLEKDLTDMESIIIGDFKKRVIRRIMSRFVYYLPNRNEVLIYFLESEIKDIIKSVLKKDNINEADLNNYLASVNKIDTDLYYVFLKFINDAYLDKNNTFFKDELLKAYYNIIYLEAEVEDKMINNNFHLEENINVSSLSNEAKLIQKDKLFSLSYNLINSLLNVSDEQFSFEKVMREVIIRECLLRSSLALIDESDYEMLHNYYLDTINDQEYQNKFKFDKICKGIIANTFNKALEEKNKLNIQELKR